MSLKKEKGETRIIAINKMDVEIEALLYKIEQETKVDRALVLKFHNGGPKMFSGVAKYTSVITESHSPTLSSIKQLIQNFPVDRSFMNLLIKLNTDKQLAVDVNQLDEGSLKRRYIQDGCKTAMLVELVYTESGLYFLDLSGKSDFILSEGFTKVEQLANRIRNIYQIAKKQQLLH